MARRTYGEYCALARALDLVGERWGLLVVRELLLGPKRFTDLRAGLPNLSPDVLSQRLRDFERAGIAHRRKLAPPAGSWVYELTGWGHELEPVVLALGRFGSRAPLEHVGNELGTDSLMLALKTLFDDDAAAGLDAGYELRLGEEIFRVRVAGGVLEVARGGAERPDAAIIAEPAVLRALLWHGRSLGEAIRAGDAAVEGDRAAVERFLTLFPVPEPAAG